MVQMENSIHFNVSLCWLHRTIAYNSNHLWIFSGPMVHRSYKMYCLLKIYILYTHRHTSLPNSTIIQNQKMHHRKRLYQLWLGHTTSNSHLIIQVFYTSGYKTSFLFLSLSETLNLHSLSSRRHTGTRCDHKNWVNINDY